MTNQEGPWLHAGWKSNVSQQEVRADFFEGAQREQVQRVRETQKGKEKASSSLRVGGCLLKTVVWCP